MGFGASSQLLDFNTNQNQNNVIATAFKPPAVKRVDIKGVKQVPNAPLSNEARR